MVMENWKLIHLLVEMVMVEITDMQTSASLAWNHLTQAI